MLYRTERQVEGVMQWLFTVLLLFCIQLIIFINHCHCLCPPHPLLTYKLFVQFLSFYMYHKHQQKRQDHHLPAALCAKIISELTDRSIIESESATFYRREIEKYQEYISLVQNEAARIWEPPSKPEQLDNMEDVEFFQSQFCLKNKLLLLQEYPQAQADSKMQQSSRNNGIRDSASRQRSSSTSVFAWSQHRYSILKQHNQARLKQKKGIRQLSLQKLLPSKKEVVNQSQKELREGLLNSSSKGQKERNRPYRKMVLRKKQQPIREDDAKIPILLQMAYNIGQQTKVKSFEKKDCLPKLQQTHKRLQKMQSTVSKGQSKGRRLVISQYEPNRNQIKVSHWRKFNQMIENPHPDNNHAQKFADIRYFTETTTN